MGTELATTSQTFSLGDLEIMAAKACASRLFMGVLTEEAAFSLMLLSQADGLHPIDALRRYHIIEGRPSMKADAMQAEFMRHGGVVRWVVTTAEECRARFIHPTFAPDPGVEISVKLSDLVESGVATTWDKDNRKFVLKKVYRQFPAQMLRARVISQGVRMITPGVVSGIYTPEETEDIQVTGSEVTDVESFRAPDKALERPIDPAKTESRTSINEAFSRPSEPPARQGVEQTTLVGDRIGAKGLDTRTWTSIMADVVKDARDRVERLRVSLELEPEVKESFNIFSVGNHLVRVAVDAGAKDPFSYGEDGRRRKAGPGLTGKFLEEHYRMSDAWREWLRVELHAYLAEKLTEAEQVARNEAHGDSDPEEASQEPPVRPEDESQLVPTGAGDGWAEGRQ